MGIIAGIAVFLFIWAIAARAFRNDQLPPDPTEDDNSWYTMD